MYYSSPQIDPVRNAVSSSEQTSLRCSSLPSQRARCTDRHANRECVCSCVHQHTHTHPRIDALTVGSRRREDSAKCPALLLWSVDVLSSYKDCDTNVDCPHHPSLSLSVSPVSHSSFPLLPVPLSPSLPSTLPPATFVPFNAANDCRFFSPPLHATALLRGLSHRRLSPSVPSPSPSQPSTNVSFLSSLLLTVNSLVPPKPQAVECGDVSQDSLLLRILKKERRKKDKERQGKRWKSTFGATIVSRDNGGS